VPATIVFVQGEEQQQGNRIDVKVPTQVTDRIYQTIRSDSSRRARVALVPLPAGVRANSIQLGQVSDRDVGFTMFRDQNAKRSLAAFRLQPIFIPAVPDEGRYTAEVQRSITLEQVFDPEQERYEHDLSQTVVRDLGFENLRLRFKRLAVEDNAARRDSADKMAEQGDITRREHREAHGFAPLPEAAEGEQPEPGQVPFGWNDELLGGEGPPPGAENRVVEGTDQRGLQPGMAGRRQRSQDEEVVRGEERVPLKPVR